MLVVLLPGGRECGGLVVVPVLDDGAAAPSRGGLPTAAVPVRLVRVDVGAAVFSLVSSLDGRIEMSFLVADLLSDLSTDVGGVSAREACLALWTGLFGG